MDRALEKLGEKSKTSRAKTSAQGSTQVYVLEIEHKAVHKRMFTGITRCSYLFTYLYNQPRFGINEFVKPFFFRSSGTGDFLTFDTLTLVPVQSKLILPELLTREELEWLNEYHEKCR